MTESSNILALTAVGLGLLLRLLPETDEGASARRRTAIALIGRQAVGAGAVVS